MKKIVMAVVTAVGLMAASTAQALPTYTSGSFAFNEFTSTTTDVTTTTSYVLSPAHLDPGSPTGDFGLIALPATLAQVSPLDFLSPGSLDWTDAGLGHFHATLAVLASSGGGLNAFAKWNVFGTYTVGSDFANSGAILSADETWSLTQTGGPGHAISLSGTFDSPAVVRAPEPGTLALFGAGLAGLLALRRRRKTGI